MRKLIRDEKGNVVFFAAFSMVILIGFAALSIDISSVLSARNQLQVAIDASALSGATGLLTNQTVSTIRAIATAGRNNYLKQPVTLTASNISFPQANQIMVQTQQSVNLNFASLLGVNSTSITTTAIAEVGTIIGTIGLKPWAVPDNNYNPGDIVCIKSGELGAPSTNNSFFYPVDFPPVNRGTPVPGACTYKNNIINGTSSYVAVNDIIQVEPGNMIGPTRQGVNVLISQDPGAYWDPSFGTNGGVVNSSAGPDGTSASPRVVIIPMYDPNQVPDPGRKTITITRLGAFFVTEFQGRNLYGTFMQIWHQGTFGSGNSMIKGIKLVQ